MAILLVECAEPEQRCSREAVSDARTLADLATPVEDTRVEARVLALRPFPGYVRNVDRPTRRGVLSRADAFIEKLEGLPGRQWIKGAAVGLAVAALIFLVIPGILGLGKPSSQQVALWIRNVQAGADVLWRAVTAVGIIVGGVFAYYKFFREDPYSRRIQPTVSGSVARKDGLFYLRAVAQAKNYGQGTITLDNADTGLRVLVRRAGDADWTRFRTPGVFAEQEFLDSGETISEPVWLEIPEEGLVALRLDLYVAESEAKGWLAREVVNLVE